MEPASGPGIIRFGVFEVDLSSGELRREGRKVSLQEKPFQVLALLLEHPGEVVTREHLRERLWAREVFVDFDQGLNSAIKKLRLALQDSAENPRFVETLARRGYRFIAPVGAVPTGATLATDAQPGRSRARGRVAVLLALALAVAVAVVAPRLLRSRSALAGRSMLLVLPFQNLSGEADQEYFSDGLTEEMISRLGRLTPERLAVIGRASAMHYKGTPLRADQIGRELGVEYLLSGSVRRSGGRVRVTVALVRTRDQVQLWSDSFDREMEDVLEVQSGVAQAVVTAIPLALSSDDRVRLATPRPVRPQAYEAYLRGLYFWNQFTVEAEWMAVGFFETAIREDPSFAPAHAFLASTYQILAVLRARSVAEMGPKSRAALARALELDPDSPEAHAHLGWANLNFEWDFPGVEPEFRRALELHPNLANARHGLGLYLAAMGRPAEGLLEMRKARDLDPLSPGINADVGILLYYTRDYEAAVAQCRKALELDPRLPSAHWYLSRIHVARERHEEAMNAMIAGNAFAYGEGADPEMPSREAYRTQGWTGYLRQDLKENLGRQSRTGGFALNIAVGYLRLGDKPMALDWLEKALDERSFRMGYLKVEPTWDPLRSEPRFQELLRRVGLAP